MTVRIDYEEELGSTAAAEFRLTEVIVMHETLDLALFQIAKTSAQKGSAAETLGDRKRAERATGSDSVCCRLSSLRFPPA